jgi:uncharacterized protein (UPF0147 family)
MAKQPTYIVLPEDTCLSQSQLFDYIDGKLSSAEMHMAEKHLLSCGFCSDALEGMEKIKSRDKVAAFIPFSKEEEKEKPKVIPLHPNRKYFAMAAAVVFLVAITFLMKLAFNNSPDNQKMADRVHKDSWSAAAPLENKPAYRKEDSVSNLPSDKSVLASGEKNDAAAAAGPGNNRSNAAPSPVMHNAFPEPDAAEKAPVQAREENADGDDADNFANVVDAKVAPEKDKRADYYASDKELAKQEQSRVADQQKKANAQTESKNADDNANAKVVTLDEVQQDAATPQKIVTQSNGTSVSPSDGKYTWTPATGSSTTISNTAVPPGTTSGTISAVTDSTSVMAGSETEAQGNLSYENGVKMLNAGQAAASLAMFDKVLQDPNHPHYADAKWEKAEALIQLKRTEEAKTLLNELAAKPGKYQQKAKDKLKSL